MTDILIIAVVAGIVGLAGWFLRKARKRGARCIGCPSGGCCSGKCQHSKDTDS